MSDQTPPNVPPDPYAVPPAGGVPPVPPPAGGVPPVGGYPPPPPAGYPAPTYPTAGYPGGQPQQPGVHPLAIVALVVAVIALLICWIPIVGIGAGLIALVLSVIAWIVSKNAGRPLGLAIGATVVSVLAFLAGIVITVAVFWLFDEFGDDIRDCTDPSLTEQQQEDCLEDRINDRLGIEPSP